MNIHNKCMICNTVTNYGMTTIVYKGKLLKYCSNCEYELIYNKIHKN